MDWFMPSVCTVPFPLLKLRSERRSQMLEASFFGGDPAYEYLPYSLSSTPDPYILEWPVYLPITDNGYTNFTVPPFPMFVQICRFLVKLLIIFFQGHSLPFPGSCLVANRSRTTLPPVQQKITFQNRVLPSHPLVQPCAREMVLQPVRSHLPR